MGIPEEQLNNAFNRLPDSDKRSLLDYLEYLITRATKKAWEEIPEIDESLTKEERDEIAASKKDGEYISLDDFRRELGI